MLDRMLDSYQAMLEDLKQALLIITHTLFNTSAKAPMQNEMVYTYIYKKKKLAI